MTNALSTPAQRHIVRVQPPNRGSVYLMAVQNDGFSDQRPGLLWYRSDDGGVTWSYYKDIVAQPDQAVFDSSRRPATLHLTADLVVVGNDIAAVYSYDATQSSFPADAWDPQRVVYFQWWRFDGADDWDAGPRLAVASPASGQAYHRAGLARDGTGRLWVQAFLRRSGCSPVGSSSCTGDLLQAWVSTDSGSSFQGPQDLAALPNQIGGGRLIAAGSQLLMLWGDYKGSPAQLLRRNDSDPLTQWSAKTNAFADGAGIYHGSALSAVAAQPGGVHLVYKRWVASPDVHQLYYRHFDGSTFGAARSLGVAGDWATQPAITSTGDDVYICVNHVVSTNANYEVRAYRLSRGFAAWDVIDTQVQAKAYPNAPERVPSTDAAIPCAFGMGNNTTSVWGAGHTVQVAQQPVQSTPSAAVTPTFSPAPGSYASAQAVALSSATAGATIFFTTDGTTPTTSSTRYTGPIAVGVTTTIRAIATATGLGNSAVASGTYSIQGQIAAATPTFSPAPGSYASAQAVALSSATAGATIFFTTDGTTPTTSSTRYAGPIPVGVTTTIRAIATATGFGNSAVASGAYTIQSQPTSTLFSDEFARTSGLGASWRTWYGSYSTNGSRAVSGAPPIQGNWASVAASLGTSDYAVVATLSIPAGSLYSGVVARSSASDFTRDLYTAQLSSTGAVSLYRRNGWTWTLLRSVSAGVQANRFYALQLVTTGTSPVHLEVWLDGQRLISHDDSSASRLTSGAAGIENYSGGVQYESFSVLSR